MQFDETGFHLRALCHSQEGIHAQLADRFGIVDLDGNMLDIGHLLGSLCQKVRRTEVRGHVSPVLGIVDGASFGLTELQCFGDALFFFFHNDHVRVIVNQRHFVAL